MTVSLHGVSSRRSLPQSKYGCATTERNVCGALSSSFASNAGDHVSSPPIARARIDEQLLGIATQALLGLPRTVHAIAVALLGPDLRKVRVPHAADASDE